MRANLARLCYNRVVPRIVDHDQRRSELTDAVWSLIREQGIAGVTIRSVSARSGWSSGAIRHYLPNREAILNFAAQQVNARAEGRIRALPRSPDERQNVLDLLTLMLPLDEEGRVWMEVWLAFVGAAVSDQQYADTQGLLYRNLNGLFRQIFSDLHAQGWLPRHTPIQAATELHAVLDGLSVHLLLRQIMPEQATAALSVTLDRLLSPP